MMAAASPSPARRQRALLLLLVFLGAFALYLAVASRFVAPFTIDVDKGPMGADTRNSAEAFLKLKYEWKHPLMSPVTWSATQVFRLAGFERDAALAGAVAMLAALNVTLFFLLLARVLPDRRAAALGALAYALSLANLGVLGVTDSYTVSCLAILLFLHAWLRDETAAGRGAPLRLGALAGLAGLANVPLLLLAGLVPLRLLLEGQALPALKRGAVVALTALALVAAVVLPYSLVKHGDALAYFERAAGYTRHYGEIERIQEAPAFGTVAANFLLYAVATPQSSVPQRLDGAAARGYLRDAWGLVGLLGAALVLVLAAAALLGPRRRTALPLAAWLVMLIGFYVFFNPVDATLYAVQGQPVLFLLAALGTLRLPSAARRGAPVLAVLALLLLARNLPVMLFQPYGFAFTQATKDSGRQAESPGG